MDKFISRLNLSLPFVYGEFLSWDRWRWIVKNIPQIRNKKIIDIGCGRGVYAIELSKRGGNVLGVSNDEEDIVSANERSKIFNTPCLFRKVDARNLDKEKEFRNKFDIVIASEIIEHLINDEKFVKDIYNMLNKKGTVLLTTPYDENAKIGSMPISKEDGGHVRLGYNKNVLKDMFEKNGFKIRKISYVGGPISKASFVIFNKLGQKHYAFTRTFMLPIKFLFPIDYLLLKLHLSKPSSICICARKG
jgi:cyclopropane fatty-acyl-phospholipid synthase-like methyltransferase